MKRLQGEGLKGEKELKAKMEVLIGHYFGWLNDGQKTIDMVRYNIWISHKTIVIWIFLLR